MSLTSEAGSESRHTPSYQGAASCPAPRVNGAPRPTHTFDTFVVGSANEFAYRAARAIAEREETDIGTLYLHGPFGYGKTHLLHAIAHEAVREGQRPLYFSAEDFMRQHLGATHRQDTPAFEQTVLAADLLLVDDLHYLCRSTAAMGAFLRIMQAFVDQGRRVVAAAECPPGALESVSEAVRTRLSTGLVVALGKPDRETRLAILMRRTARFLETHPSSSFSGELLEYLADLDSASPGELIGTFTKLATYADLTKKPGTIALVALLVAHRSEGQKKPSIDTIQRKVAEYYELDVRAMHSAVRTRRLARPRQVAMYLVRELTMRSLPEIGKHFGDRDHTTVMHACRKVAELCRENAAFREEVRFLRQVLSRPSA